MAAYATGPRGWMDYWSEVMRITKSVATWQWDSVPLTKSQKAKVEIYQSTLEQLYGGLCDRLARYLQRMGYEDSTPVTVERRNNLFDLVLGGYRYRDRDGALYRKKEKKRVTLPTK